MSQKILNLTGSTFRKAPSLYQEFLAEREEILRYGLESERLGKDIGFERARSTGSQASRWMAVSQAPLIPTVSIPQKARP